jgi:hypothetical protein
MFCSPVRRDIDGHRLVPYLGKYSRDIYMATIAVPKSGSATVSASNSGGTIRTCSNWPMALLPSGCWNCELWRPRRNGKCGCAQPPLQAYSSGIGSADLTPPRSLPFSWLRVSGTTKMPQIDQSVRHQLHTVMASLFELKAQQKPFEFVLPREGPLHAEP